MAQAFVDLLVWVVLIGVCLGIALLVIRNIPLLPESWKGIAVGIAWCAAGILLLMQILPMLGLHL